MSDHQETTFPCRDCMGRERNLLVFLSDDHDVVLKAPPGESAFMRPGDVSRLREALRQYAAVSLDRRGGER
jgi:hypothetical protein